MRFQATLFSSKIDYAEIDTPTKRASIGFSHLRTNVSEFNTAAG
jgi:hypothetical protein